MEPLAPLLPPKHLLKGPQTLPQDLLLGFQTKPRTKLGNLPVFGFRDLNGGQ